MSTKEKITAFLWAVAMFVIVFVVSGLIVSALWNELIPVIFGLTTISWFQGIELTVLVYALFGPLLHLISNSNDK